MKHRANLTICRPGGTGDEESISIIVRDTDACSQFVEVQIPLSEFSKCLTGLSEVPCTMETRRLDIIGKRRQMAYLEFLMPEGSAYHDKEAAKLEAERICSEGWEPSTYFNSQSSFFEKGGEQWARTHTLRWVTK